MRKLNRELANVNNVKRMTCLFYVILNVMWHLKSFLNLRWLLLIFNLLVILKIISHLKWHKEIGVRCEISGFKVSVSNKVYKINVDISFKKNLKFKIIYIV